MKNEILKFQGQPAGVEKTTTKQNPQTKKNIFESVVFILGLQRLFARIVSTKTS